jgi:A/G-specific adenine glycosylase
MILYDGGMNLQHYPWKTPHYKWHGLLAEILLQRTRADSVVPIYNQFIERFSSPLELAKTDLVEIEKMLYPLGLKWRAKWIKKLGWALAENGLPSSLENLLLLPGIGQYSANAFLAFHSDHRALLIDSNTTRFLCRLTGVDYHGETRREPWVSNLLTKITPLRNSRGFNTAFLDFAMVICKPSSPNCLKCPLARSYCTFAKSLDV